MLHWLSSALLVLTGLVLAGSSPAVADSNFDVQTLLQAKRVLFLGDSITFAGDYIAILEKELLLQHGKAIPELINLGLPSETCTGLSEPEHPFPRPNVHERAERALSALQPDVVFICYGMNDGIYFPFAEERFAQYQQGIRDLLAKVRQAKARVVLMTPPPFDPLPLREKGTLLPPGAEKYSYSKIYENYDAEVLQRYAEWIMTLENEVDLLIDLHTPTNAYVAGKRLENPTFSMSPDGVHVNSEGHEVLASVILDRLGIAASELKDAALWQATRQRQTLLRDAWVSHVGHLRPGMKAGLPVEAATMQADALKQSMEDRAIRLRPLLDRSQGGLRHLHYPASKLPGELTLAADYYLWLPPGVERLRGVIVHQHGCGDGASKGGATSANDLHWRALAAKWDCALLGTSISTPEGTNCRLWCDSRNGSDERLLQALRDFSTVTGHAELETVPWCLWGHSGGGFWASLMQLRFPERIIAIWLQSGEAYTRWSTGEIPEAEIPAAAYQVPVVACPGFKEKDDARFQVAWNGALAMFRNYRLQQAPFIFAPDPITGHECGDSRYLAIPFFDACLRLRLPAADAVSQDLKPIDLQQGWLGNWQDGTILPRAEFPDTASAAELAEWSWLPDRAFALAWQEFIRTGAVSDATPPPAPSSARMETLSTGQVRISWEPLVDFESGIAGFRIQQGDRLLAEIPENPRRRFGRPLWQAMSYHDTPEQPLPRPQIDLAPEQIQSGELTIQTLNTMGMTSEPLRIQVP